MQSLIQCVLIMYYADAQVVQGETCSSSRLNRMILGLFLLVWWLWKNRVLLTPGGLSDCYMSLNSRAAARLNFLPNGPFLNNPNCEQVLRQAKFHEDKQFWELRVAIERHSFQVQVWASWLSAWWTLMPLYDRNLPDDASLHNLRMQGAELSQIPECSHAASWTQ